MSLFRKAKFFSSSDSSMKISSSAPFTWYKSAIRFHLSLNSGEKRHHFSALISTLSWCLNNATRVWGEINTHSWNTFCLAIQISSFIMPRIQRNIYGILLSTGGSVIAINKTGQNLSPKQVTPEDFNKLPQRFYNCAMMKDVLSRLLQISGLGTIWLYYQIVLFVKGISM